jgi:hypothetical protein
MRIAFASHHLPLRPRTEHLNHRTVQLPAISPRNLAIGTADRGSQLRLNLNGAGYVSVLRV